MKKITADTRFFAHLETFINDIVILLSSKLDVSLSKVSAPQNVMCYQTDTVSTRLQLRLVMIPFKSGEVFGRLSWLDQRGHDHACCYLNKDFDCFIMASNGDCLKQTIKAETLCFQEFMCLMNEFR